MKAFGVDIGGTGIKGAPVDTETGQLAAPRLRIDTPQPATPDAVAEIVVQIVEHFEWSGPVGCTFPAVVKDGKTLSAANVDRSWIGIDVSAMLTARLGRPVAVHNDAESAGVAEMRYGAGAGRMGTVHIVTLGTGIGSALFRDGVLVPHTEFGHIEVEGRDAESLAAERAREEQELSWKKWAKNVQTYLRTLENLIWPDLFIIGGGVSKKSEKFFPLIDIRTEMVAAKLLNDAGIVGAALNAPSP